MNYIRIHDNFIEYCKHTTPISRLKKRNKNDYRLNDEYLYTEKHHIIPRSQGGKNLKENLVELLPEEHIFIHFLRFKAFKNQNDMWAFRYCINGLKNNNKFKKCNMPNKFIRKYYSILKQYSGKMRKEFGWQTADGRKRISNSRKNKMPVKDAKTGEKIGSVDVNHPKVISGEWVHQTKGEMTVIDTRTNEKVRIKCSERKEYHKNLSSRAGDNNTNYSGITDNDIINYALEFVKLYNFIPTIHALQKFLNNKNIAFLKIIVNSRFEQYRGGFKGFVKCMEKLTNLNYNPYTKEYKNILRSI